MSETYLIRKDEIAAIAGTAKQHFLNPAARRTNKSLGDAAGLTGLGFHLIEVEPGDETTEYHVHHYEDEAVYVLDGTATAIIGEDHYAIGPGDFIGYRAGGHAHTIVNTGTEVLRLIVVGQRLAHDVSDYPRKDLRLYRNPGRPWEIVEHGAIEHPGPGAGKK